MASNQTKEDQEGRLRKAVLDNYLARWAGRFGVPRSSALGFKLLEKSIHWNSTVFSYDIFLVKQSGINALSEKSFYWEGHLNDDDAEKIFLYLLNNKILTRRKGKHYFNLSCFNLTVTDLKFCMLELDKKGLLSTMATKLAAHVTKKFSHTNTIHYIRRVLRDSVLKIEKATVKITRLGGESLSKSTVFRVVEAGGNNEVVKVDPNPLSWNDYAKDVKNQREVARCLGPEIKTLVPGIAFALSGLQYLQMIPRYKRMFYYQGNLSAKEQDNLFGDLMLEQANKDEHLREFLEVNDSYGYFMPFLEEGILEEYLNAIHGYKEIPGTDVLRITEDINSEMANDFNMLQKQNFDQFIDKYDEKNKKLLLFIKKQYLKNSQPTETEFTKILEAIMLKDSSITVCEAYRKIIATYLRDSYLQPIEARDELSLIFAGLLKVFAILRQKGIAIRDLKSGNIYITENLQENGILDLLDFETAIIYTSPYAGARIPQPRLGGTPSRATPSLWFSNEILQEYYGEQQRALYLPDLYAIIEIIYSAITREPLFSAAKRILQDIFKIIQGELDLNFFRTQPPPTNNEKTDMTVLDSTILGDETTIVGQPANDMLETFKTINPIYWEKAFLEFQGATKQHEDLLSSVTITIPQEFADTLKTEIELNCQLIESQIEESSTPSKTLRKELTRQDNLLKLSFKEMSAYKLLQLLFITVALYMNRSSPR